MVISDDVKAGIEREFETHTLAQLSTKYGVSKSSVSRIVAGIKKADTTRREEASQQTTTAADGDHPQEANSDAARFEYVPEEGERTVLELDGEAEAGGLSKLLNAHVSEDPLDIEEPQTEVTASAPATNGAQPEGEAAAPTEDLAPAVSDADMDMLLKNLMPEEDVTSSKKRVPTRSKAVNPMRRSGGTVTAHTPASSSSRASIPTAVLITQCKLYLQHFPTELEAVTGKTDAEKERYVKQLKPTMDRNELLGILASIRGTLCIQQSVAAIESSIMVGAGCAQSLCPLVGMNLSSPINVLSELDRQRDAIRRSAVEMVITDFDWYQQKASPSTSLALLLCQTIFATDAQNRSVQATREPAPAQVPLDLQEKYSDM